MDPVTLTATVAKQITRPGRQIDRFKESPEVKRQRQLTLRNS